MLTFGDIKKEKEIEIDFLGIKTSFVPTAEVIDVLDKNIKKAQNRYLKNIDMNELNKTIKGSKNIKKEDLNIDLESLLESYDVFDLDEEVFYSIKVFKDEEKEIKDFFKKYEELEKLRYHQFVQFVVDRLKEYVSIPS